MARSRSGYKRPFQQQAPSGVKVEMRIAEAYQLLLDCATAERFSLGQYAEAQLTYALSGHPYIGKPEPLRQRTLMPQPKSFHICQRIFNAVTHKVGEGKEMAWIASTLLFLAQIEQRRREGAQREPDRFAS